MKNLSMLSKNQTATKVRKIVIKRGSKLILCLLTRNPEFRRDVITPSKLIMSVYGHARKLLIIIH